MKSEKCDKLDIFDLHNYNNTFINYNHNMYKYFFFILPLLIIIGYNL